MSVETYDEVSEIRIASNIKISWKSVSVWSWDQPSAFFNKYLYSDIRPDIKNQKKERKKRLGENYRKLKFWISLCEIKKQE